MALDRITIDPQIMSGKPCIRGTEITVGTIVDMLTDGRGTAEILSDYPFLEAEDINQALSYAMLFRKARD